MSTRTTLQVPEVHCDQCKTSLEGAVGAMTGVTTVEVSIPEASLEVDFDESSVSLDRIKHVIEEQGYAVFG